MRPSLSTISTFRPSSRVSSISIPPILNSETAPSELSKSTRISMSLDAVSSPREHDPNSQARFIGFLAINSCITGISRVILLLNISGDQKSACKMLPHKDNIFRNNHKSISNSTTAGSSPPLRPPPVPPRVNNGAAPAGARLRPSPQPHWQLIPRDGDVR